MNNELYMLYDFCNLHDNLEIIDNSFHKISNISYKYCVIYL